MKRPYEPEDEDETTGDERETKKVKFPVVVPDELKPLPEPLKTRLKQSRDLNVASDNWSWNEVTQNLQELGLAMNDSTMEKDNLDQLIEADIRGPRSLPAPLLLLHRDILRSQQKMAQDHVENGEFRDDSSGVLVERLKEEEKTETQDVLHLCLSNEDVTHGLRRIDYSVPFVLQLSQSFRDAAKSLGHSINSKAMDEAENPLTLKMLKENPEGHGLDKNVVERFSDDHEIVDVQLNLGGKRKTLRAFKDRRNILIQCKDKNCQHGKSDLDINHVSICPKSKQCIGKDLPEPEEDDDDDEDPEPPSPTAFGPTWNVDISNDDVVICEADTPQITSVQSLADVFQPITRGRLTPLASQLPNPAKKFRATHVSNRHVPNQSQILTPIQGIPICSSVQNRPSILSRTGHTQTHAYPSNTPGTYLLVQQPAGANIIRRPTTGSLPVLRPIPTSALTASQLKNCATYPIPGVTRNSPRSEIRAAAMAIARSHANMVKTGTPKIDAVYTTATTSAASSTSNTADVEVGHEDPDVSSADREIQDSEIPEDKEKTKEGDSDYAGLTMEEDKTIEESKNIEDKSGDKASTSPTAETVNGTDAGPPPPLIEDCSDSDDDAEKNPGVSSAHSTAAPINFAKNIFEDPNEDEEMADDEDGQEEVDDNKDFDPDVPQIVSTAGGVVMMAPETIVVTPEVDPDNVSFESPAITRARAAKQKLIRAKADSVAIMGDLKHRLEFPAQKAIGASYFVVCPICEEEFPYDGLQLYRNHLGSEHNILMKSLSEQNSRKIPASSGRVGRVESVPQEYLAAVESPKQTPPVKPNTIKEWYRCKACDQLLTKKDTSEHRLGCCPNQRADFAFTPVKIASGKKAEVPLVCGLCERSCDSAVGLRQHLTLMHKEIASRILLEPDMRCGSCLTKFDDSIHLTLHCQVCTTRKASPETMLELAQGTLYCEICQRAHDTINETQDCYTNAQMIRCIICLNVVLSRGNFFHHMKTYHFRSTVGICCPFCDLPEIAIRDCFIHIIDNHYNPVLQLHKNRGIDGVIFGSSRIVIPSPPQNAVPRARPSATATSSSVQAQINAARRRNAATTTAVSSSGPVITLRVPPATASSSSAAATASRVVVSTAAAQARAVNGDGTASSIVLAPGQRLLRLSHAQGDTVRRFVVPTSVMQQVRAGTAQMSFPRIMSTPQNRIIQLPRQLVIPPSLTQGLRPNGVLPLPRIVPAPSQHRLVQLGNTGQRLVVPTTSTGQSRQRSPNVNGVVAGPRIISTSSASASQQRPILGQTVRFVNPMTNQPQHIALRTVNPAQVRPGQLRPVTVAMLAQQRPQTQTVTFNTAAGFQRTVRLVQPSTGVRNIAPAP